MVLIIETFTKCAGQFSERKWNNTRKLLPIWNVSKFRKSKNNFPTGYSAFRSQIESKSAKQLFISQEKFGKKETSFLSSWYDKRTWLHRDGVAGSGYCIICKNADPYNMLNDIRVGNSFIKTGCSNWKHAGSTEKGFHQHEFSNWHQKAIKRLKEILKSMEDVSEMIKNSVL